MFGLPDIAPVYLDYAASTPVDPQVAEAMQRCLTDPSAHANPSSMSHTFGQAANAYIDEAGHALASALGVAPRTLVWTSGATESDNLAVFGAARYRADRGNHVITSRIEHKAVLDAFAQLEKDGFEVTWLLPDANGIITVDSVKNALRDDTTLVSLMWVNNEIGVINPIADIGALLANHQALFHVDAAQAFGKLPMALSALPIDLMSLTAHKCYGPKGIGALYVADRDGVQIEPMLFGGGQQRGLRPGTLATHQIVGFGAAAQRVAECLTDDQAHLAQLGASLEAQLLKVSGVSVNGAEVERLPSIINVSVEHVSGDALFEAMAPVALATGSACNSMQAEPSFVMKALGHSDRLAEASLRFSIGRNSTQADIDTAAERFAAAVGTLRAISGALVPPGDAVSELPQMPLSGELAAVAGAELRFCGRASSAGGHCAVQLSVNDAPAGRPKALKFNAFGSTSVISACAWWCRQADNGQDPTASMCLQALELPRQHLADLLIIEDAWQQLLACVRAGQ